MNKKLLPVHHRLWHKIRTFRYACGKVQNGIIFKFQHMQVLKNPTFIFCFLTLVIFFFGLGMKTNQHPMGDYVMYASFILGGIFWLWSIISVISASHLKKYQRNFWLIGVIAIPFFGGMIYTILHSRRNQIAG